MYYENIVVIEFLMYIKTFIENFSLCYKHILPKQTVTKICFKVEKKFLVLFQKKSKFDIDKIIIVINSLNYFQKIFTKSKRHIQNNLQTNNKLVNTKNNKYIEFLLRILKI